MQVDKEALIKHHYWILLGIAIPLELVVLLVIAFSVSGKVEAEKQKVEAAKKTLDGITQPKNQAWLTQYEERNKKVSGKQNEVWEKAWRAQDGMMTWPERQKKFQNLYFGDPIDSRDRSDYSDRPDGYTSQVAEIVWTPRLANELNPPEVLVQYKGGWNSVLRFVKTDGVAWDFTPPELDEVWLAQEDLWVQRELLRIIRDCNDAFATFKEVPEPASSEPAKTKEEPKKPAEDKAKAAEPAKDKEDATPAKDVEDDKAKPATPEKPKTPVDPRHRKLYNAYWDLDLHLVKNEANKWVIRGSIKNRTKVRRALSFFLRVRVQEGSPLWGYVNVDGEPVAGGETLTIKESSALDELNPQGIYQVEQVLNWRTAPVKRVDLLAMGAFGGASHRQANRQLMPPKFVKEMQNQAAGDLGTGGGDAAASPGAAAPDGGMPQAAGAPGMSGGGMQRQNIVTRNGLVRNRYIDVTEQVRRMPVGMVVVVDQAHVQDFLTAFANARLRVQTTQVHWQHLHENIRPADTGSGPGSGTGSGAGFLTPGGMVRGGQGDAATPDGDDSRGAGRPGGGSKFGGGRMAGGAGIPGVPSMPGMPGSGRSLPGMMPPGMGGMMMPGMGGMPGMMMPGMGGRGFAGMSGLGEDQEDDMSLVELAVYGIASLYERFPPRKEQAAPADPAAPPAATPPATTPPVTPAAGS